MITKQQTTELESRINQTIDEFNKDKTEITTSDINGILLSLIVVRTVASMEKLEEKEPTEIVQSKGQSPVFKG